LFAIVNTSAAAACAAVPIQLRYGTAPKLDAGTPSSL
jgi:hypothetical protein